ncbi:N-acylethanolamine-hydrolyzing acid amidase-like [Ptychodera flava]|uniref:N-acylethanolamine-hydrolyzing acid amidase-like n=1 Tax=Ptychodera flava TaxID=63121 RepID=UPI00396A13D4
MVPIVKLPLLVLLFVSGSFVLADKAVEAPRFVLDLDAPPEHRWSHIIDHWGKNEVQKDIDIIVKRYVPQALVPALELIAKDIDKYLPSPYKEEITGMAAYAGVNLGELVALNIIYDISAFCTSIVAQDSNGVIWHGRNLDYQFVDVLRNITLIYDAQKNGETVYTATTFLGYTGVLTGMKPNGFTVSVDQRNTGSIIDNLIELVSALLQDKSYFVSFLVRDTLLYHKYFHDAVESLAYTEIVASVYYIVGGVGPGEGAVITRNRKSAQDVWFIDTDQNRWFLVETNYDHWKPPPSHDDRRTPANKAMIQIGQDKVNDKKIYGVLSTAPLLRSSTAYTATMSASHPSVYDTWSRYVEKQKGEISPEDFKRCA